MREWISSKETVHNSVYSSPCNFGDYRSFEGLTDEFGHLRIENSADVTGDKFKACFIT